LWGQNPNDLNRNL